MTQQRRNDPTLRPVKRDLIAACKILSRQGLVQGFGHVSARIPNSDKFLLTPRVSLELVRERDLLLLGLNGEVVRGQGSPPFEAPLHAAILKGRREINAVARIHARKANYFGATKKKLEPVHNHGCFFFGGVPVFAKSDLISTAELADEMLEVLGDRPAVLLRGNGQVVVGQTVPEAVMMAIYLEETADIYYAALQIGAPIVLSFEECQSRRRETLPAIDLKRGWEFFKRRAEGT